MVIVDFINEDGGIAGRQKGFMMSHHDKTVVFTPFNHNKNHFTHLSKACFMIYNKYIEMTESEYAYPFFMRIWTIPPNGLNSSSEFKTKFPRKNHMYENNNIIHTINNIIDCDFNGWHISLPPIYVNVIKNKCIDIGTVTYMNNNISGIVILNNNNDSIILGMYFLKKLIKGYHTQYAGVYYGLAENNRNQIYVKENWNIYTNLLEVGDIILEIEDTPARSEMRQDIIEKDIYLDTWISWMFFIKDKLKFKIRRNNRIMNVTIPCIPIDHIIQYNYYSDNENEITFEKMYINNVDNRYKIIGEEIKNNPNKLFI
jgi:hypothetical protein